MLLRFLDLLKSTKLRKHCTTPLLFFQSLNDFTYCFICLPLEAFRWYSRGDVFKLVGKGFCDIWPIMGFSIVGISYWNLCLISINRNLAMYDPKLGKAISFSYLCIAFSLGSRIGDVEVGGLKNHYFLPWGCSSNVIGHFKGFLKLLSNFFQEIKSCMPRGVY